GRRVEGPGQQREERRLAGAVGTDERHGLALAQLEVGRPQRDARAVGPAHAAGRQDRLGGAHGRRAAAGGSSGGGRGVGRVGACSTSTSTGIVPPSVQGSSVTRSAKNSQIARPAASSGSATNTPGSP